MDRPEDRDLPAPTPANQPAPAPTRRLTTGELEAVIRRAVELQSDPAGPDEGVSEADVVRIGQELGLEPAAVRRAVAEVRGRAPEERGALTRLVGPATVRASRVMPRPAAATSTVLDRYLRKAELMVPQRRFPDRTRYGRDTSLAAGLSRIGQSLSRSHKPLRMNQLDISVSPLDDASCLVEVSSELRGVRGGLAGGVMGSTGGAATAWAATVWATPIADPLMLLGVPALAGAWLGMRAIYESIYSTTQDKLESLLDRLEHDELR
ncbi:MAG TPA: hypothetical protein VK929_08835 [Longimicrobiales bacterium]|nr:hypothetical protein [Longimicrobiales bacterium]